MIGNRLVRYFLVAAGLSLATLTGCGKKTDPANPDLQIKADSPSDQGQSSTSLKPTVPDFNQSFADAVITEVLEGHHLPPDTTIAGKKTGPLRIAVEKAWPSIKMLDGSGKPIPYRLKLETLEGVIEIMLNPELAPNHVRNMLVLANHGYYDGLVFERTIHDEAEVEGQNTRLDLLIAGCPLGTGDEGHGHLGYFMRSEAQTGLKHVEGTVGFWHDEDSDSAGCRFYICLGAAPALDGKFTVIGNVTQGIDVAKRIAAGPVRSNDRETAESEKPVQPVSIKKATISPEAVEK